MWTADAALLYIMPFLFRGGSDQDQMDRVRPIDDCNLERFSVAMPASGEAPPFPEGFQVASEDGGCGGGLTGVSVAARRLPGGPHRSRNKKARGVAAGFSSSEVVQENLPDVYAIFRLDVELVAFLDVESGVPGVHVAHDAVGAEFRHGVRIGDEALAGVVLATE